MRSSEIVALSPVIPVVVVRDLATAVPLARALVAGGVNIIEVTLRTDVALDAIRMIADEVPDILVGAGTVRTAEDVEASIEAGAQFLVSPGTTPQMLRLLADAPVPALPGVATASEVLAAYEAGFSVQKFFPAGVSGGVGLLASLAGPIPEVVFCPTGGVGMHNAAGYLALPNVACVGGSWLTPDALVATGNWVGVAGLAADAARLRG